MAKAKPQAGCLATYARQCISGYYRLFSISEISSGRVIQQKYIRQEELAAIRATEEHKRCVKQLRDEHEIYLSRRQSLPQEFQAEFNHEEIAFLEEHTAWLCALATGDLQPNAFEQVRFIAVSKGILLARTERERIWKRYLRLCGGWG